MGVCFIFTHKKVIYLSIMVILGTWALFYNKPFYSKSEMQGLVDKLENGQNIRYLVIGDSIGRGSGAETPELTWFSQLEHMIQQEYGSRMIRHHIVQSGATSFEGIYKLQSTTISPYTDLVFIVFGENDRKYMLKDDFAELYENLLRQTKKRAPYATMITMIESSLPDAGFAQTISDISHHYGAVTVDMRPVFESSHLSIQELTKDSIHPNGNGYRLYANELIKTIHSLKHGNQPETMPPIRWAQHDFQLKMIKKYKHNVGFTKHGQWLQSNKENDQLVFRFNGPLIGAFILRGPDGGLADIYIDGDFHSTISTWWPFQRERYIYLANNLGDGTHELTINPTGTSSQNNLTQKSYIRVSGIIVKE